MVNTQDVTLYDETSGNTVSILDRDANSTSTDGTALVRDLQDVLTTQIANSAVTVTAVATLLPASALSGRKEIIIFHNGSGTIFIGDVSVTSTNGFPLPANTSISFKVDGTVSIYGIKASGSSDVRILELK